MNQEEINASKAHIKKTHKVRLLVLSPKIPLFCCEVVEIDPRESRCTPTHGHFALSQVFAHIQNQYGSRLNSMIDLYDFREKRGL